MTTGEVAEAFTALLREGRDLEAGERFWAPDVTSLEPMQGDMARLVGPEAIRGKHDWWNATFRVLSQEVSGPYVHGDQFALHFAVELEGPEGRGAMREVALYTVRDGRIVEERFFAAPEGG